MDEQMKKMILFMLVILFVLAGMYITKTKTTSTTILPCIKIDTTIYLSGLKENATTQFTIYYQNISKDSLQIKHVETFCGCLECMYSNGYIAPFEKDSLKMNLKPLNRGYLEKDIYVYIGGRAEPLKLTIKGFVKSMYK